MRRRKTIIDQLQLMLPLLLLLTSSAIVSSEAQFLDQQEDNNNNNNLSQMIQQQQQRRPTTQGRLTVLDKKGEKSINLSPGLLEESLLKRGSFDFDSRLVKFDKLKVLGNIYVLKVNGHKLRDRYLLKSSPAGAATIAPPQLGRPSGNNSQQPPSARTKQ